MTDQLIARFDHRVTAGYLLSRIFFPGQYSLPFDNNGATDTTTPNALYSSTSTPTHVKSCAESGFLICNHCDAAVAVSCFSLPQALRLQWTTSTMRYLSPELYESSNMSVTQTGGDEGNCIPSKWGERKQGPKRPHLARDAGGCLCFAVSPLLP